MKSGTNCERKQYLFEELFQIGNVMIGGHGSQIPTVLIGSIFHMRHKIVKDAVTGTFDENAAAALIDNCQRKAAQLRISFMLDVIGSSAAALVRYVTFIKKVSSAPILINSTSSDTRTGTLLKLAEAGMLSGIVYNSINPFSTEKELVALTEVPIEAAVIQAYNPKSKKPDGPLKALLGNGKDKGLLDKASECGIRKVMIDIPVLDLSSIGLVAHSTKLIKDKLKVPVGTAPANATYTSSWLKDRGKISPDQFKVLDAAASAYLIANGCNFLFFGPIEAADWIFPACAMVDAINVYGFRHLGINPATERHPLYVVL